MKEVEQEMPGALDVSSRKSVVLDRWLNDPRVDRDMASKVLREVSTRVDVHIGRNYVLEMQELLKEERLKEEEGSREKRRGGSSAMLSNCELNDM